MVSNILLISEIPDVHRQLIEQLVAAGFQVSPRPTLSGAMSLLRDPSARLLALVLDLKTSSQLDFDLLAELNALHPAVSTMIFPREGLPEGIGERLREFDCIRTFGNPLSARDSYRLISMAIVSPSSTRPGTLNGRSHDSIVNSHKLTGDTTQQNGHRVSNGEGRESLYSEEFLRRVGLSDAPLLLHGETGVGKEVMARRLWHYSSRVGKPFLKLNCAALPSELTESELFGYEKGAFTGASIDKPGKFEMAQNGTILLDEIGDMDIRLQAKLLQVLQDGEVQPLGSSRTIKVNVRVMAATHRDLRGAIAQGAFREDLYYRLSVINIFVPPLRERRDEILPLADQLLLRYVAKGARPPSIPEAMQRAMLAHPWPGNVRELENLMRRFLIYQDSGLLTAELEESLVQARRRRATDKIVGHSAPTMGSEKVSINRLEQASRTAESKLLLETLESVRWNRRRAAQRLSIDYKAFLYKLQKHGIVESNEKRQNQNAQVSVGAADSTQGKAPRKKARLDTVHV